MRINMEFYLRIKPNKKSSFKVLHFLHQKQIIFQNFEKSVRMFTQNYKGKATVFSNFYLNT